ncbi:MAG TPA: cyclic pyranopterin monophosphate synthase MoaC [Armatimonadota bacterium]|nr:cyclic pyranopterin monophosphate synthase MoaC [Armatimonadota bacterium]
MTLSHLDAQRHACMVDVSGKAVTVRTARAGGTIFLRLATLELLTADALPKGDAYATSRIAGIQAAKRCAELIPLCHTIPLDHIAIEFSANHDPCRIEITATVTCQARTGAEMEALLAVSVTALTIYDMIKAVDREATIGDIRLLGKSGGRSGHFQREAEGTCQE